MSIMAVNVPPEVALSLCGRIREENRRAPSSPQSLQCRRCGACSGGRAIKSGDRACCLVRQRYSKMIAVSI